MMADMVAGDLYEGITGQLFKIGCQLRQQNGYLYDPHLLRAHLQAAIEGRFSQPIGTFQRDMGKEGWKLLENIPRRISGPIVGVPFLKGGESSINGEEVARRAQHELCANYGQEDAEWLLNHQDMIPAELWRFYLLFPGTKWWDSHGDRRMSCMYLSGNRWFLDFDWLDCGFDSYDRLVRLYK